MENQLFKDNEDPTFRKEVEDFYNNALQHSTVQIPFFNDLTYELVPIFSRGSMPYFFKDIRIPEATSGIKHWGARRKDIEKWNKKYPWSEKANKIYWRGSTTGGHITAKTYEKLHRYRWVQYATRKNSTLATKANVGFSFIIFCEPDGCEAIRNTTDKPHFEDIEEYWKHKVGMDLEGFCWSTRLKMLLYSNNIVFKPPKVYQEWFQDLVIPWKHYVPIKFDFTDVEEKLDKVIAGDQQMLKIAQTATEFAKHELRVEDSYCYTYKLLLEYTHLLNYTVKPLNNYQKYKVKEFDY